MICFSRFVFAWMTVGLLALAAHAANGDDPPPRKLPKQSKLAAEVDRFRALDPVDRMKLITKLAGANEPFAAVKRGDLTTAVVERGTIDSADATDVICMVKARAKDRPAAMINWIIDDGSMVKKGQKIAILDPSALKDEFEAAAVKVKDATAALEQASENVQLAQKEGAVEVRLAEIDVKLAEIELKELPAKKPKEAAELKVEQAKLKLERATARAKTQLAQAEADKRAKVAAKELESERQDAIAEEIRLCTLVAPADGMLIYHVPVGNRFGSPASLIAQGETVREGQKLMRVVGLKKFAVETRVHESMVSTLKVGQAVQVRVDALPDKEVRGKVQKISPIASQADWMTADIKVYPVTITLEEPPEGLKPDMTVQIQIATGERKAVLQVPRSAVVSTSRGPVCFVKSGDELIERKVATGAGNATTVEVAEGLKEGETVVTDLPTLLVRP